MKTNFFLLSIVSVALFSCQKEEIKNTVEQKNAENTPVQSGSDTITMDTIYDYYLDGTFTKLSDIVPDDGQVWAVVQNSSNGHFDCYVASSDANFLSWWSNNGGTQSMIDHYQACMEIRDYAIENDMIVNYEAEEDLNQYPQHFRDYVLERIPDYFGSEGKKENDNHTLGAALNLLYDGYSFTGTSRTYTVAQGNYGSFSNLASSLRMTSGSTLFCDFAWFGGRKWYYVSIIFTQFGDLNTANNRFNSHF